MSIKAARPERFNFDAIYKKHRAEGRYGWHDRPLYAGRVATAEAFLARNGARLGDTILVLGCGAGQTAMALSRRGFDVSGVDISPEAIAWAREAVAESSLVADLHVGDVVSLTMFADESFRFVLDDYCLQCVIGPDRAACLASVFRVLQPLGVFHAGTDRAREDPTLAAPDDSDYDPRSRCLIRDSVPYSYLTVEGELERELADAGFLFRSIEHRPIPGRPSYHAGRQWVDAVKPRSPP